MDRPRAMTGGGGGYILKIANDSGVASYSLAAARVCRTRTRTVYVICSSSCTARDAPRHRWRSGAPEKSKTTARRGARSGGERVDIGCRRRGVTAAAAALTQELRSAAETKTTITRTQTVRYLYDIIFKLCVNKEWNTYKVFPKLLVYNIVSV